MSLRRRGPPTGVRAQRKALRRKDDGVKIAIEHARLALEDASHALHSAAHALALLLSTLGNR